jgi:hypothetical protein
MAWYGTVCHETGAITFKRYAKAPKCCAFHPPHQALAAAWRHQIAALTFRQSSEKIDFYHWGKR